MNDERELADRCRRGEREAQRELYELTSTRIYRVLLKITRDPESAFDLAQDTYLRAFGRMSSFDGRSSISTWLYRIAVNLAIQFLRQSERARRKLRLLPLEGAAGSAEVATAIRLDLAEALDDLTPTDRAMLILKYQEGLDYRSIADAVGCAAGTVASRLHRARQRLHDRLAPSYAEAEEIPHPRRPKSVPRTPVLDLHVGGLGADRP